MGILSLNAKQKSFVGNFLSVGTHNVQITSVSEDQTTSTQWADATPGIVIEFKDADGKSHKEWYHTKGYKKYSELNENQQRSNVYESRSSANGNEDYAVIKSTGERMEDATRTEKCLDKLRELGGVAGFEIDEEFDVAQLDGKMVSITIHENAQGKNRIHYVNAVKEEIEA